ncbi:MAG: DUF6252 family protein [Raineya sp.]|nr:DUF6252 family protein [Raineya sp.]
MKRSFIFILVGMLFMMLTCIRKQNVEPTLPPETQNGANTFGCKVNGKVWLPNGRESLYHGKLIVLYDETFQGGNLSISAFSERDNASIIINVGGNCNSVGEYIIYDNSPTSFQYTILRNCVFYSGDKINKEAVGKLTITKLDKMRRILSGTFYFTIENACGRVEITEGRFDLKY